VKSIGCFLLNKRVFIRLVYRFLFFLIIVHVKVDGSTLPINFDKPFPTTRFTDMLTTCMELYGDIRALHDYNFSAIQSGGVQEALKNRFAHLNMDIDAMMHQECPIAVDDMEFMMTLLDTMHAELAHIMQKKSGADSGILQAFTIIKEKVELFLEKVAAKL